MFRRPTSRTLLGGTKKIRRDGYSNDTVLWWDIRKKVFKRDGGKCRDRIPSTGAVCGKPGREVHHIIPLGRGGTTTMGNLITLCDDCHDRRHPGHPKRNRQ